MYNYESGQYYNHDRYQNNYGNQFPSNNQPSQQQIAQQAQNSYDTNKASENDKFPSVIGHIEASRSNISVYETSKCRDFPPIPGLNYRVVDKGCASPRYIRSVYHIFPSTTDLAKKLTIPLGFIVQPCAQLFPEEELPSPIDMSSKESVPKCLSCKCYASPFIKFHNGGCKFLCPFCRVVNDVPEEDMSSLDYMGVPLNILERPDLRFGSYEYIIRPDHCQENRVARPPVFIFMLDVSYLNVNNGLLDYFCTNLKSCVLSLLPSRGTEESPVDLAFVTYDNKITLYGYSFELMRPVMITLTDIEEICLPIETSHFLMEPSDVEEQIDGILALIKEENCKNTVSESILGPVINFGVEIISSLKGCGRLYVFHSTLPTAKAPGSLHIRGGANVYSKKPSDLLIPQNKYYEKLGEYCCNHSCSVELFLFPNSYCDLVTLSSLCTKTGGKMYKYDSFQVETDGLRFMRDLQMNISAANQCFDCSFTTKTCLELKEVDSFGCFTRSQCMGIQDVAVIDQYSSFGVELSLCDNFPESGFAYLQFAMVYTSLWGDRRIRVHNVAYAVSNVTKNVMNVVDCFATAMILCKRSLSLAFSKSFDDVENLLVKTIGMALAQFSKDGNSRSSSSLNLPTCIQILPILTLGFLKIQCFLQDTLDYDEVSICHSFLMMSSVDTVVPYFYPFVYDLHGDQFFSLETLDYLLRSGTIRPISCDYVKLEKNRAYLIDSGFRHILWIGDQVDHNWIVNVTGKYSLNDIDSSSLHKNFLMRYDSLQSRGLFMLIDWLSIGRSHQPKFLLTRGGGNVQNLLVENSGIAKGKSYKDFLMAIHYITSEN